MEPEQRELKIKEGEPPTSSEWGTELAPRFRLLPKSQGLQAQSGVCGGVGWIAPCSAWSIVECLLLEEGDMGMPSITVIPRDALVASGASDPVPY